MMTGGWRGVRESHQEVASISTQHHLYATRSGSATSHVRAHCLHTRRCCRLGKHAVSTRYVVVNYDRHARPRAEQAFHGTARGRSSSPPLTPALGTTTTLLLRMQQLIDPLHLTPNAMLLNR